MVFKLYFGHSAAQSCAPEVSCRQNMAPLFNREMDPARPMRPGLEEVPLLQAYSPLSSGEAPSGRGTLTVGALQLTPP